MLGLPIRLCLLVVVNLLRLLQNAVRLLRGRPSWVRLSLKTPLPARPPRLGPFRRRAPSLAGLAEATAGLAADARVEGIVIDLHALGGGWVQAQTLRALIGDLRAAGKRVVVHLSSPTVRAYYVACAADQIFIDESGFLGLRGLAAEATFFGGALAKIGAEAQLAYRGPYKSFAETFMRSDMSAAHREALDAILDRLHDELVDAVAGGRKLEKGRAAALLVDGPYPPARAAELGLVDGVAYDDEVAARLGGVEVAPFAAWARARLRPFVAIPLHRPRRRLVVVPLHGSIVGGEGTGGRTLGAEAACRTLDAVAKDPGIVCVVLHVDSRGGSAPASDRIWHAIRRVAEKKPVVAYLDEVAASGGYYLALGATRIVARSATLTGSIGVVAGKLSLEGLYQRLGLTSVALARGPAAAMDSSAHGYSDDEKRRLGAEVDAVYQLFVRRVADGRKLATEAADALAQGRVWIGADAHARGLVDELGGIDAARRLAERLATHRPEKTDEVAVVPRHRSLLSRLAVGVELPAPVADALLFAADRTLLLAPAISVE